jgi:hypothetical protein
MMRRRFGALLFLVALIALLVAISGCGDGSGSSSSGRPAPEPSSQFKATKADKKIVDFGEEAPPEEREAAGLVLAANFKAREAADFSTQCSSLSRQMLEQLSGPGKKEPAASCPSALRKLAEPLSGTKNIRKDTLGGPITALRCKGAGGYALFHGTDGGDYAMPMNKEGGEWKVGALVTTEL